MSERYRCTSLHAEALEGGPILEPGESISSEEFDVTHSFNKALIDRGALVKVSVAEKEQPKAYETAVRRAEELGVNIEEVLGTGSDGMITVKDVEAHQARVDAGETNNNEEEGK